MPGNALLSVYDKTGLDRLAWIFSKLQVKMLGSGGTAEAVKADPVNFRKAVDNIDIGGVALIRAAGKGALLNHRVVPVTSPKQYEGVVGELERKGYVGNELRQQLAREAFVLTADYDGAIRDYLAGQAR